MFLSPSASLPLHQSLAFFSQECGLRQCALGPAEGGCGHTPVLPASSKTSRGQQIDPNLHTFSLSYSLPAFPSPATSGRMLTHTTHLEVEHPQTRSQIDLEKDNVSSVIFICRMGCWGHGRGMDTQLGNVIDSV